MATTLSLSALRTQILNRADMANTKFIGTPELNDYINQSYFELYDLLITLYEDYYVAPPLIITTDGVTQLYNLPDGTLYNAAPPFYKLLGVDLGLDALKNAFVTLKKFDFISRNRYVFPQLTTTYLGVFNLRYRLVGGQLMFIPVPSGNQFLRIWYIPRLQTLSKDTDLVDGISGWTEYIIADCCIKLLEKEESDPQIFIAQKQALIKRIEDSAMNRDAGQPDSISDTRSRSEQWGTYGPTGGDGPYGGF